MRKTIQRFGAYLTDYYPRWLLGVANLTAVLFLASVFVVLFTGCATTAPSGPVVDVHRIDRVRAAVQPVIERAVARVIERHPGKRGDVIRYTSVSADIFCRMSKENRFSPDFLVAQVDELLLPHIDDELALAAIAAAIVVYELEWSRRVEVPIPEDEWMWPVARMMCDLLDGVVKELERGALRTLPPLPVVNLYPR